MALNTIRSSTCSRRRFLLKPRRPSIAANIVPGTSGLGPRWS
jgi:hypothetical protein